MNLGVNLLIPEIVSLVVLAVCMFKEVLAGEKKTEGSFTPILIGSAVTLASLLLFGRVEGTAFGGMVVQNSFSFFFKLFFTLVFITVAFMCREYFKTRTTDINASEFALTLWCPLIGLYILSAANHFLIMFVALEVLTMSLYIMAAYLKGNLRSIEAGLKYLILGSLSSGFLIFGIALLYLLTGTLYFHELAQADNLFGQTLGLLGIIFIVAGLGFKIAAFPFQLWVPDVYEGSPTPVVAFMSVASKAAGFVLLIKFFGVVLPVWSPKVITLLTTLALLTLLYGNLGALVQTNMKRLLGYSGIGHAGYLLIALAAMPTGGNDAILYYLVGYALSSLALFYAVIVLAQYFGGEEIKSYEGLAQKSPFLAGVIFIALLSLAGVPPFAGFFGKFLALYSAVKSEMYILAFIGALVVAISLYYYLSIVVKMYFRTPENEEKITTTLSSKIILGLLTAFTFIVGIFQEPFVNFITKAVSNI